MSQSIRTLFALSLILAVSFSSADAAPRKPFATEKAPAASTSTLDLTIKKPPVPRGSTLTALQLQGCWTKEGIKSVTGVGAKKEKIRFKFNAKTNAFEFKQFSKVTFPIKAKVTFTTPRTTLARTSLVKAVSKKLCKKDGKKIPGCIEGLPVETAIPFHGVECTQPSDFQTLRSEATVALAAGDAFTLHPSGTPLQLGVLNGAFAGDVNDLTVIMNGNVYFGSELTYLPPVLTVAANLADGKNEIEVRGFDAEGKDLAENFTFWAGANSLLVRTVTEAGVPVEAAVTLALAEAKDVAQQLNTAGGNVTFTNVPSTTVVLTALAADGSYGSLATAGREGTATITLIPMREASTVDNNSILLGADGWNTSGAPVTVAPHVEVAPAARVMPAARVSLDEPRVERDVLPVVREVAALGEPDQDITVFTSGEGVRFMTRTFRVRPGTKRVTMRYRFVTSEYPGGYFGSRYNDYYNVSMRTGSGASIVDEGNSMNALGQGAFTPSGYTQWRESSVPVKNSNEVVQVVVAVANVADGAYNSHVTVDKIEEKTFVITKAEVNDLDGSALENISGDNHTYFQGFTHIFGSIRIDGDKDDSIKDIALDFSEGDTVKTSAALTTTAAKLLKGKFGKKGFLEIKSPTLLFKIFPNNLTLLRKETSTNYTMRIRATSAKGKSAELSVGSANLLTRFAGANRYDARDVEVGGDDWAKPEVKQFADERLGGFVIGDFSNMNGGAFPPHDLHRDGRSVDVWFDGYNALNGDTARSIISFLNTPGVSNRVSRVYARYRRSEGSTFFRALVGVRLADGRSADRVILPDSTHGTHMHLEINR
ncbi:MAG: hypothetical protein IT290_12290 [Deltaproteobacteria bacterium]|nr:hypothetical protein [Deltaproteobacteria bacterium]